MDSTTPILPAHIEETVASIAQLHAQHYRDASFYQKTIDGLTAKVGSPPFIGVITAFIVLWAGLNLMLPVFHAPAFDPPPFGWLQGVIAVTALYVTVLILTTQRRENQLAEHRAQLTLEIALVSEQKMAKLIEMSLQERRDNPLLQNTLDTDAIVMSMPADPQAMLDAIKLSHNDVLSDDTNLDAQLS